MPFESVVGQRAAVAALRAHLARTGGAGATLLLGPEGTGRFLLARSAAVAILGSEPLVRAGRHPDLNVLTPDEGIDGVRRVAAALQRRPAQAERQVLIIRDADRLGQEALNALLKTLEEPPAGAALFLVATDTSLLPETVVSRCRTVRAHALSEEETARVLQRLGLPAEGARDAAGSPGRALFQHEHEVGPAAARLLDLLGHARDEAIEGAEELARKRPDEDTRQQRRRLAEVLSVAAARLRRDLPESESVLRCVVEALRSLGGNANPTVLFADLALYPWKQRIRRRT